MHEEILEYARLLGRVEEDQEALLNILCQAAEAELAVRLREGVLPEDCGGAFPVATAWLALAGLCAGQGAAGEPSSWSAGAVSVSGAAPAGERAESLRRQALRLMVPYIKDESFCFLGVRG